MTAAHEIDDQMPSRRSLRAGMMAVAPMMLAIAPYGLIFGTLAANSGFDLAQTLVFSSIVFAGASQLASLQVLSDGAPAIVAILTGAIVNMRMAMYSASIATHWPGLRMAWRVPAAWFLHDQSFGLSIARYRSHPDETLADKIGFFIGAGALPLPIWILCTWIGAEVGAQIPASWGVEFAAPVVFIAVAAPLIRGTGNVAAALASAILAVAFAGLPWSLGLAIAAIGGIAAGMVAVRIWPPVASAPRPTLAEERK